MTFLSPTAIAIAAGLTIPPLIALYFLKLKRQVRLVPSTLLWKKAIEDLHVNAPFQRLRASLLLLLQLAVLILAALALGKPMRKAVQPFEDTVVILIDQSASMGVVEADGRTRLEAAKEQAKLRIDNLGEDARAMVIAFCDRATVVASFDAHKDALKRKIDSIEQTQSTSQLGEAMALAEAYTQVNLMGAEEGGTDRPPEPMVSPATVFIFSDGRVEDADAVALQKFEVSRVNLVALGERRDNVGIIAMDARRHYEQPQWLEVAAVVQNFGPEPRTLDAVLYVAGQHAGVQTVTLAAGSATAVAPEIPPSPNADLANEAGMGDMSVAAFDPVEFESGGVVEVVLRIDDALAADDRAWTVVEPPRPLKVLLVAEHNWLLERALAALPLTLTRMTPAEYEAASEQQLSDGKRSLFDVVVVDRHNTSRLPVGNYFFWEGIPRLAGLEAGGVVDDEVVVNWDETHPMLRHVAVESLLLAQWRALRLPSDAEVLIEGETGPVLAYLTREGSQFLLSAFSLVIDRPGGVALLNTHWSAGVDFIVFLQNAVQTLASNLAGTGRRSVRPGEPITLSVPSRADHMTILRPDGSSERIATAGAVMAPYARTHLVGAYRVEPAEPGADAFAVNLFNANESQVAPAESLTLGAGNVSAQAASVETNRPFWPVLLLALLGVLVLEWVVYNQRVFV